MQELTDVRYEEQDGLAWITIDRPERLNSFTAHTVEELIECFKRAISESPSDFRAFEGLSSSYLALAIFGMAQRRSTRPRASGLFEIEELHRLIREVLKPVIAAVNGLAIGGGHVLHVICDLSVAAEHARFGQAGPRVGSFDAGFGTGYLARVVGEKRAREIWFLCRQYSAEEAERWGLVNSVVAGSELKAEVRRYADQILALSPTALRFLKQSFNADSEHPGRPGVARLQRSRTVRALRGGPGGARRLRREAPPGLRALSLASAGHV